LTALARNIVVIAAALLAAVVSAASSATEGSTAAAQLRSEDRDGDGYIAADRGGDDCVDQYSSVFIEGTNDCDPTRPPIFLRAAFEVADHSWVQDAEGLFHLYHHAGSLSQHIYHYTSAALEDLVAISTRPVVSPTPAAWDFHAVWAPHVVQVEGVYYMFYTGTTGSGNDPNAKQRIGLATSTDLEHWTKYPINNCADTDGDGCVYECDEAWTAWGNGVAYDDQCRDPFVIRDDANDRWVMFTTVRLDVQGVWSNAISVATSTDLVHWTGAGYIGATATQSGNGVQGQRSGGEAENGFVTRHGDDFYLLFTDWRDELDTNPDCDNPLIECTMVQYVSSPTLEATPDGSPGWEYRGYTPDQGVNAIEVIVREGDTWIQSQSVANENSGDAEEHERALRLKRMVWSLDGSYTTSNLTKLVCRVPSSEINPGASEVCDDTIDNNCSGETDEALCVGTCIDEDGDGYGVAAHLSCTFQDLDCDDTRAQAHPRALEICDGIDNDCDERIDEGHALCWNSGEPRSGLGAEARTSPTTPPSAARGTAPPTNAGRGAARGANASRGAAQPASADRRPALWSSHEFSLAGAVDIWYTVPATGRVALEVFDVSGRRVRTLVSSTRAPGRYRVQWDGLDSYGVQLARGIYLIRLTAGSEIDTRKVAKLH
jgi:hypothetical protein